MQNGEIVELSIEGESLYKSREACRNSTTACFTFMTRSKASVMKFNVSGENLYESWSSGSGLGGGARAADRWYNEHRHYNYNNGGYSDSKSCFKYYVK